MRWQSLMLCAGAAWLSMTPARAAPVRFLIEDFRPFSYLDGDAPAGPVPEVMKAVCAELAESCTIEQQPWRRVLQAAQAGEATGTFVADLPERRADFWVTTPFVQSAVVLFERAESDFAYRGPDDLGSKRIGVYGPSGTSIIGQAMVADAHGTPNLVLETGNDVVLRMVSLGRYGPDGLGLVNREVGLDLIRKEQIPGLKIAGSVRPILYGLGLARKSVDEAAFRRWDAALVRLEQDGAIKAILTRYGLEPAA